MLTDSASVRCQQYQATKYPLSSWILPFIPCVFSVETSATLGCSLVASVGRGGMAVVEHGQGETCQRIELVPL